MAMSLFLKDFHVIVSAVYSLLGNVSSARHDLDVAREHTATVFQRFDKSHQGYITIQDFVSFCLNVRLESRSFGRSNVTLVVLPGSEHAPIDRCPANHRVMIIYSHSTFHSVVR